MMTDTIEAMSVERLDKCPLCDGPSWKTLPVPGRWIGLEVFEGTEGNIGLVRCRSCGLVFTNPRPSRERLSAFYSGDTYSSHEATGSPAVGSTADYLLQRIAKCLPHDTPRTMLDYGAGGGGFLSHAGNNGWSVRGFEPGRRGLESCRQAGLDVTDKLEDLPSGEFGLVTMLHVFEHLANPFEVLEGARRLLAKKGRLYIEVPNAKSLRARMAFPFLSRRFQVDERHRAFPIHLMYYSDRTLRRMLEKAGWTVEATFTHGIGLDEFFISPETSGNGPETTGNGIEKSGSISRPPTRRIRHKLRDAFLSLGIGENVAVIARCDS